MKVTPSGVPGPPTAAAIRCRNLNVHASHSAASAGAHRCRPPENITARHSPRTQQGCDSYPDRAGALPYSPQDRLAASRHLPENAPRQIDLTGAPQPMTENTH